MHLLFDRDADNLLFPVEDFADVQKRTSAVPLHTARNVKRSFDVSKTTALKILRKILRMFPYLFHRVQMFQHGYEQHCLDFANYFQMWYDEDNSWQFQILWTD